MIRDSVVAMTVIDLFVVATVLVLTITICRLRPISLRSRAGLAALLSVAGLGMVGILFLADLLAMHLMPALIGQPAADQLLESVHLDWKWIVIAASTPLICLGFVMDSIERKRERQMLQRSEARFRSIVHDHIDMLVRWKGDGIRTWVNEPYCKAFGLTRDEATGTSFFPSISEIETVKRKRDALTPALPVYTNLHEVRRPNGTVRWQEWTTRGLFNASGKLVELQSIGRDITDRIRTARALQESEARFRGLVENTLEWVFEIDLELGCTYSNRAVENILGYTPEALASLTFTDIIHGDDIAEITTAFESVKAAVSGWHRWNYRYLHRNGSVRYVESSASPIYDQQGELVGYRGVGHDFTLHALLQRLSMDPPEHAAGNIDEALEHSFCEIAASYGVDRVGFWHIDDVHSVRSHSWTRESYSQPTRVDANEKELPEVFAAGRARRIYKLESLNELSPDAPERAYFRVQEVKSILVIPIYIDDRIVGSVSFSTLGEERRWPEQLVAELQLLSEKIVSSYQRAAGELASRRHQRDLAQSEELAHVGSYAFYPGPRAGEFPDGWLARFSSELRRQIKASAEEASFELLVSRIHEEDRSRFVAGIQELIRSGVRFEEHYRIVNPDGSTIHVMSRADIEPDRKGNITRIVGSNRDITEQVNREDELVAALTENERLRSHLEEENVQLREEMRSLTEFDQIIGDSEALRASLNLAARAAPTDANILILGETGTGKELVAKAIHQLSSRRDERLVSINCTALPASLIESELFGHERGAFTGASNRRAGRFELADRGTLFLDEIGDLPLELQAKLLRVLEDGGFERLGGNNTIRPDVRLIAATNHDLEAAVEAGTFRADLYYRLNTVPIELPPLRRRKEDIPMLAQHFVEKHRERLGKSVTAISTRMIEFLLNRNWPGNVRELEHYIERSLISATGKVLSIGVHSQPEAACIPAPAAEKPTELKSVERQHILQILSETGWVIDGASGAAAALGLAPSTLRSRMKRLGISRRA